MRGLVLASLLLVCTGSVFAQRVSGPRVSPHEKVSFSVDGGTIAIEYGRPSKKGREIWGTLVPWDHWWMPGADEATIITTDATLVFDGLTMPAGQHTLYMAVDREASKLIINNQVGQFHTQYPSSRDLGRVNLVMTKRSEPVEQLTFVAEPRTGGGGILKLLWDDREYSATFTVKR